MSVNAASAPFAFTAYGDTTARLGMAFIARLILIAAGAVAALFVARDALNFPVAQAVAAILLIVAALVAWAALSRRR